MGRRPAIFGTPRPCRATCTNDPPSIGIVRAFGNCEIGGKHAVHPLAGDVIEEAQGIGLAAGVIKDFAETHRALVTEAPHGTVYARLRGALAA